MKCDNCGKNEVNFHYTSNINGNVTEKHLCAECASKLGCGENMFFDSDRIFEDMLTGFFGSPRTLIPFGGFGYVPALTMPRLAVPRVDIRIDDGSCAECKAPGAKPAAEPETSPDPEIVKRREINALNEQMRKFVEAEEFEKAAEVRDRIRKLKD